jgi:hypothetical protein
MVEYDNKECLHLSSKKKKKKTRRRRRKKENKEYLFSSYHPPIVWIWGNATIVLS